MCWPLIRGLLRIFEKKRVASVSDPGESALVKEETRFLDVSAGFAAVSADGSDTPARKDR
jgi:hypothetical protein